MSFEPAFMHDLEAFRAALAEVRTPAEWARFQARWFADRPWPRRTPEELERLRAEGESFTVAGRAFTRAPLADDLTPEARHAFFSALAAAFHVLFPAPEDQPGAGGSAVRLHCPACEWWTDTPGDPACPACGRPLLRIRVAPPG